MKKNALVNWTLNKPLLPKCGESTALALLALVTMMTGPSAGFADSVTNRGTSTPALAGATIIARPSLALLPPMGWNSWNCLTEHVTEQAVREMADAMVSSGMKDAGYQYIVVDDFWEQGRVSKPERKVEERPGRDAQGILLADPVRFPSGIKALADYVHSKGLKFGVYTSPGESTCGCNTASYGHIETDLNTFAAWGVDFIKLDMCGDAEQPEAVLQEWRAGINRLNRPMIFSSSGIGYDYALSGRYADMWRTTTDLMTKFRYPPGQFRKQECICSVIDQQIGLERYSGPGHWNDPDMLRAGNAGLSLDECRAHFGMWAMLAAPLIAGNDLRIMKPEVRDILINREVLAVDQDPAGRQGYLVQQPEKDLQVWVRPLVDPTQIAVALLNRGSVAITNELSLASIGIHGPAFFRDLFAHQDLGLQTNSLAITVPAHGIRLLKLSTFEFLTPPPAYVFPLLDFSLGPVRIEAEDDSRVCFYKGYATNALANFSGESYVVGVNGYSLRMRFNLPVAQAGNYHCTFRYQNTGKEAMSGKFGGLSVNFVPTRDGEWQTAGGALPLKAGMNHVQLYCGGLDQGELAIDCLDLQPQ